MVKLKTLKDLRIEEELCEKLDTVVYLPTKRELEGKVKGAYSLGFRKEDFKGIIAKKMNELRQEAINWIKKSEDKGEVEIEGETFSNYKVDDTWYTESDAIVKWIKHFFNIKKEDLKNVLEKEEAKG